MSSEKKMAALKELTTLLGEKATPPIELWNAAGFPTPKRLKEVEQAITALRKMISAQTKAKDAEEERREAEAAGISLEEMREQKKKPSDQKQDKRRLDDERKAGRQTKANEAKMARGEFDLVTEYVGGGEDE